MAELKIPPYLKKWVKDLGTQVNEQQIGNILKMVHSSAIDIKVVVNIGKVEVNITYSTMKYIRKVVSHL